MICADNLQTVRIFAGKGIFQLERRHVVCAVETYTQIFAIEDIYTGNGVSELINLSMSALLDSGDEVLVPSPDYPLWTACVTLAGSTAVHYLCDEQSEWYPILKISAKTMTAQKLYCHYQSEQSTEHSIRSAAADCRCSERTSDHDLFG